MDNQAKININAMPKWFKMILALLPLAFILLINTELDSDFYFLYPTGEYIVNHGFPTHDILSMHGDMEVVIQQWLSTVIFYYIYSAFGKTGIYLLTVATYLVFTAIMFKLCKMISDNHFITCVGTIIACLFISSYQTSRPQIFTYILLVAELYFLEKYVMTGKVLYLVSVPILSVLLVNTHSSMWTMVLVMMLPYIAAAIPFRLFKIKNVPCCKFVPLVIAFVSAIAAGFLNPYGIKSMLYITSSVGYSEITNLVSEMDAITITYHTGAILIAIMVVMGIIMLRSGTEFNCRYVLLFAGLSVFSLMSYKSVPYFFIGAVPAFVYYIKDTTINLSMKKSSDKSKIVLCIALVFAIGLFGYAIVDSGKTEKELDESKEVTIYSQLDKAIDILDEATGDVVLYAGYNYGQYLEFYGYHPYLDARAELFLEDNNNDYNYMKEYYELDLSQLYYKEFLERYNFNYLVVSTNESYLYTSLLHDDDYEILYNGYEERKAFNEKHKKDQEDSDDSNDKEGIVLFALKDR